MRIEQDAGDARRARLDEHRSAERLIIYEDHIFKKNRSIVRACHRT